MSRDEDERARISVLREQLRLWSEWVLLAPPPLDGTPMTAEQEIAGIEALEAWCRWAKDEARLREPGELAVHGTAVAQISAIIRAMRPIGNRNNAVDLQNELVERTMQYVRGFPADASWDADPFADEVIDDTVRALETWTAEVAPGSISGHVRSDPERVRRAVALLREGRRMAGVHLLSSVLKGTGCDEADEDARKAAWDNFCRWAAERRRRTGR